MRNPIPAQLSVTPPSSVAQTWLAVQCGMVAGTSLGLIFLVATRDQTPTLLASWPETPVDVAGIAATVGVVASQNQGRLENMASDTGENTRQRYYCPLSISDQNAPGRYVVVLEVPHRTQSERGAVIKLLNWGGSWLGFALQDGSASSASLEPVFQMAASCLDQTSFHARATALVTTLANRYRCQRVSLGLRKSRHIEVQVLSHSAQFKHQSNLITAIADAMDEALDQDRVIVIGDDQAQPAGIFLAHNQLAEQWDQPNICTIPLIVAGEAVGAVTLERDRREQFDPASTQQLERLLATLAPVLQLSYRDEQNIAAKIWRSGKHTAAQILGPGHLKSKAAVIALVVLTALSVVLDGTRRVTADAVVEGSVQRSIAAPIDGFIATARSRAGDVVERDQELGTLEDKDLQLERMKWATRKQQLVREYREAMAEHQRSEVSILSARIQQADAEIKLLDGQLSRTRLRSPFAGVVIEGDLSQSLGTPVNRGDVLFKVAPLNDFRIMLKVNEKDIAPVRAGQAATLRLASMPGRAIALRVEKITSVSRAEGGGNFFLVEASVAAPDIDLRPGMEGVGKIEIGQAKLFWLWTHDLIDWLRLQVWSWWR